MKAAGQKFSIQLLLRVLIEKLPGRQVCGNLPAIERHRLEGFNANRPLELKVHGQLQADPR
jgi:hypothetical protein